MIQLAKQFTLCLVMIGICLTGAWCPCASAAPSNPTAKLAPTISCCCSGEKTCHKNSEKQKEPAACHCGVHTYAAARSQLHLKLSHAPALPPFAAAASPLRPAQIATQDEAIHRDFHPPATPTTLLRLHCALIV